MHLTLSKLDKIIQELLRVLPRYLRMFRAKLEAVVTQIYRSQTVTCVQERLRQSEEVLGSHLGPRKVNRVQQVAILDNFAHRVNNLEILITQVHTRDPKLHQLPRLFLKNKRRINQHLITHTLGLVNVEGCQLR